MSLIFDKHKIGSDMFSHTANLGKFKRYQVCKIQGFWEFCSSYDNMFCPFDCRPCNNEVVGYFDLFLWLFCLYGL